MKLAIPRLNGASKLKMTLIFEELRPISIKIYKLIYQTLNHNPSVHKFKITKLIKRNAY